jgi:hypothetical protein
LKCRGTVTHTDKSSKLIRLQLLVLNEDSMLETATIIGQNQIRTELQCTKNILSWGSYIQSPFFVQANFNTTVLSTPKSTNFLLPPSRWYIQNLQHFFIPIGAQYLSNEVFNLNQNYTKIINYEANQYVTLSSSPKSRQAS